MDEQVSDEQSRDEPLPGPAPSVLNIVAFVYRWGLGRFARDKINPPLEIEQLLGTNKHGRPRPRRAVWLIFSLQIMKIIGLTVIPGAVVGAAGSLSRDWSPVLSAVLSVVGAFLIMGFGVLFTVVGLWSLLPERREGGFLLHPERLWVPSIVMWPILLYLGWGMGGAPGLPASAGGGYH